MNNNKSRRTMTMALSDPVKLYLLGGCLLFCLTTLFTSNSFQLGSQGLPAIKTSKRYCHELQQPLRTWRCRTAKKGSNECAKQEQVASSCEKAVRQAYRYINTGGCSFPNQAVALCEAEWCFEIGGDRAAQVSCRKECLQVRQELEECIESTVSLYLHLDEKQ